MTLTRWRVGAFGADPFGAFGGDVVAYEYDATGNGTSRQVAMQAAQAYGYPGDSHRLEADRSERRFFKPTAVKAYTRQSAESVESGL